MKAYFVEKHFNYPGRYKISLNEKAYAILVDGEPITNSFVPLPSRLLRLSYPDFLKMVRQDYGAVLHGKTGRYITYSFKSKSEAERLVDELNKRWKYILTTK